MNRLLLSLLLCLPLFSSTVRAEDGYRAWLRYERIEDQQTLAAYRQLINRIYVDGQSPTLAAAKVELLNGCTGLLGQKVSEVSSIKTADVVLGVVGKGELARLSSPLPKLTQLSEEGFHIYHRDGKTFVIGKDERGALYGSFRLLRHLQMGLPLEKINIVDSPKLELRLLNHWDNLDRTVERGYAGFSIWNWHELPDFIDQRYLDYARLNASIGINGTVLTNVNANALVLREDYLQKVAALADVMRPYGIRVYLTARFSAPIELGGLETADPLSADVQAWWNQKANEIYEHIPDFGGFLVKANSEGQPGPQNYGRNHAEGANMLAKALAPHDGVVIWRAFVYSATNAEDRAKQAYTEFLPLDKDFLPNVLLQVKNGPIDFQPREPIHPLFGAMDRTPLMMEFQITKEYLGQGTHLVGLASLYEEVLQTDTYTEGPGTTVARVLQKKSRPDAVTGMAGVANIGTARNWTGHHFGQADWYAFGRLAWDPELRARPLYEEWSAMTFSQPEGRSVATRLLEGSHETCVRYMTPLGLHHLMATSHHYGPGPWVGDLGRPEWNPVYYHQADSLGIGFDRTSTGSNALEQYAPELRQQYADPRTCPPEFLLWFHHLPWEFEMSSGQTLWEALCRTYHQGVDEVEEMKNDWRSSKEYIDPQRYREVLMHLTIQEKEAKWWRDASLSYFQSLSGLPIPADLEQPAHKLSYYRQLSFPYAPGIRPDW